MSTGNISRFGTYLPPTAAQRGAVIAERIEAQNSAPVWRPNAIQQQFEL